MVWSFLPYHEIFSTARIVARCSSHNPIARFRFWINIMVANFHAMTNQRLLKGDVIQWMTRVYSERRRNSECSRVKPMSFQSSQWLGIFKKCYLRTILGIFKLILTGTAVSFPRKNCGVRVFCVIYSGSKLSVLWSSVRWRCKKQRQLCIMLWRVQSSSTCVYEQNRSTAWPESVSVF